ncbi:hypothetical protein RF11_12972 [Thelohanellus kitauei]|uniref:Uncharacterized protein n=1 Tax=Thelohanellus kitauei TaxID=669202 RepID=A0A0C2N2T0_THEKT|nr:hypothetical protein RF11_12972 [Thelohanellus kitauei]
MLISVAERMITEMLNAGVIRPNSSPWIATVTLPQKKRELHEICSGLHAVKCRVKLESYPLPSMAYVLDRLNGSHYISTWVIPIEKGYIPKTTFSAGPILGL